MKMLMYILPVTILVAYSQLIVKWRTAKVEIINTPSQGVLDKLLSFLSDPYIFSGYLMALLGSFLWLFVISKIPLSIGFPIYIGITFLLVIVGSWLILGEQLTPIKLISALFIFIGIVIGASE